MEQEDDDLSSLVNTCRQTGEAGPKLGQAKIREVTRKFVMIFNLESIDLYQCKFSL